MVEAYSRKVTFNAWTLKVIKVHTRAISTLYRIKYIDSSYSLEMAIRSRKQSLEEKSNIKISLKANISRNECNKANKDWGGFGYNIPSNYMEALLLYKKNGNPL